MAATRRGFLGRLLGVLTAPLMLRRGSADVLPAVTTPEGPLHLDAPVKEPEAPAPEVFRGIVTPLGGGLFKIEAAPGTDRVRFDKVMSEAATLEFTHEGVAPPTLAKPYIEAGGFRYVGAGKPPTPEDLRTWTAMGTPMGPVERWGPPAWRSAQGLDEEPGGTFRYAFREFAPEGEDFFRWAGLGMPLPDAGQAIARGMRRTERLDRRDRLLREHLQRHREYLDKFVVSPNEIIRGRP